MSSSKRRFVSILEAKGKRRKVELENELAKGLNGDLSTSEEESTSFEIPTPPVLAITNFKGQPKLPDNFPELMWSKLKVALVAIHENQPLPESLEELYQCVQNLCTNGLASFLYDELQKVCEEYVVRCLQDFLQAKILDLEFLQLMDTNWKNHCKQMVMIRSIFLFMDRTFILGNHEKLPIWDLGLHLFREIIVKNRHVDAKLVDIMLLQINLERSGQVIDKNILKNLLKMLVDLQLYNELFQYKFLVESQILYCREGRKLVRDLDVPEYLAHIEQRFSEERQRVVDYLEETTRKLLISIMEKELIENHLEEIFTKGFDWMMDQNKHDDLRILYDYCTLVKDGLKELGIMFGTYIKVTGRHIIINANNDPDKDKVMVQQLLDFKDRIDFILENCFYKNDKFSNIMKESFEFSINQRQNKPAELIAKYVDQKLRASNKDAHHNYGLEKLIDKILVIFRYINCKDIFEAFYKKDLAKRLLVGKSTSDDAEKYMLSKLKEECGDGFTSKLEGMFRDTELSRDVMITFRQYMEKVTAPGNAELTVSVLTQGYWPTYTASTVALPIEMIAYQEVYKNFYLSKHNGRKLQWQPSLGICVLKAQFQDEKELQVSLFQTAVLLQFNGVNQMSFVDLKENTKIDEAELKRTLQSLACGKPACRVLIKEPKGKDIRDNDKFTYNAGFSHKLYRIKINQVQIKETKQEQHLTEERVFIDRQYQVDAAIVLLMKKNKTIGHNQLMAELYNQVKFPVKPLDLKKRIESLIERDYMERDSENANIYNYVA